MHAGLRAGSAIALLMGVLSGPAAADMVVYYRAHGWDAFSGPDENGNSVCGIGMTNAADKRSFSIRFQIGSDIVTFRAKKASWNIPSGTLLPVILQIGLDTPWNMQGVRNGQIAEWSLDRNTIQTFDTQFRHARTLTLTFPSGSEPPWTIALRGSTAISNAFGRCITVLTQREANGARQSSVPTGQETTQPFGRATAQQPDLAPSQPFGAAGVPPAAPR
ncbi:MAG: hypothetical protein WB902_28525 [Acetobacteraceae bacterium]|jgi:hypothetical protein